MLISYIFLIASAASQICIQPAEKLCVHSKVDGNRILITVHSAAKGWTAIGQGASMLSAKIFNGWKNSSAGYTVVAMKATTYNARPSVADDMATAMALQVPAPAWANIAYSYWRPLSSIAVSDFIYAYSDIAPVTPDSPTSVFEKHIARGSLAKAVDLLAIPESPPPAPSPSGGYLGSDMWSSTTLIIVALTAGLF
jgi:hypothetical protein